MVEDFPHQASLPGGPKTGPLSDFSTYSDILKIAKDLVRECVERRGEVGWQPTGKNEPYCFLIIFLQIPPRHFIGRLPYRNTFEASVL